MCPGVERAAAGRRIVLRRGSPLVEANVGTLEDIFLAAVEKAPAERARSPLMWPATPGSRP